MLSEKITSESPKKASLMVQAEESQIAATVGATQIQPKSSPLSPLWGKKNV